MKMFTLVAAALAVACVSGPMPRPDSPSTAVVAGCRQLSGPERISCLEALLDHEIEARETAEDKLAAARAQVRDAPAPTPASPSALPTVGVEHFDPLTGGTAVDTPAIAQADGTIVGGWSSEDPTMQPAGPGPGLKFVALSGALGYSDTGNAVACFFRNGIYKPVVGGIPVYLDVESTGKKADGVPYTCAPLSATVWWPGIEKGETVRIVFARPTPRTIAGYPIYAPVVMHDYPCTEDGVWERYTGGDGAVYYP